jgi:hypothetical protein
MQIAHRIKIIILAAILTSPLLAYSCLILASEPATSSLAESLKKRDQQMQSQEREKKSNREMILAAKERLETAYIKAAWEFFSELKAQGVRFKNNLPLPSTSFCETSIIEERSDGEFIIFRANCDGVYVNFWPTGSQNAVILSAAIIYGRATMADLKFDNNCIIALDLLENKKYTCPSIMKPNMLAIVRRDVRELINKELSQ